MEKSVEVMEVLRIQRKSLALHCIFVCLSAYRAGYYTIFAGGELSILQNPDPARDADKRFILQRVA